MDKPRSAEFQTGKRIGLAEWYGDEWWLGYAYQGVIRMPDGSFIDIDRSDGAYPRPHWAGKFVIIVDDGDADWASDKEGRVRFRPNLTDCDARNERGRRGRQHFRDCSHVPGGGS